MINPNGDEFTKNDPLPGSTQPGEQPASAAAAPRFETSTTDKISTAASDAWQQTREKATVARERTEFFVRENPVPAIIGALAIGVAIGLAIRYSFEEEEEVKAKTRLGNVDLSALSMPFLWPFFRSVKSRYEDTAEVVKDSVNEGVGRLRKVDMDDYVKPLRKQWRSWTR